MRESVDKGMENDFLGLRGPNLRRLHHQLVGRIRLEESLDAGRNSMNGFGYKFNAEISRRRDI